MEIFEAIILGLVQGLTEFLPVSSSGHLELGQALLGSDGTDNLLFAMVVHGATVLSTLVIFRKDIAALFLGLLKFKWNEETQYVVKIVISMVPIGIVGLFFKDQVEALFSGNLIFVGCMLLLTACLLSFTYFARSRDREVTFLNAFVIGLSQAFAVVPGISRSGSTIATALLVGVKREKAARFSFLMVLAPIIMANLLDLADGEVIAHSEIGFAPLAVGFIASFLSGLLACKWMINLVQKGKLIYFAVYCAVIGIIAIFVG